MDNNFPINPGVNVGLVCSTLPKAFFYEDGTLWSGKEKSIKDAIKLLFKRVGKEGHVTMDVMKRTQPKTNKIHG